MLCGQVAMMDKGRLDRVSSPKEMIEELGMYAVDCKKEGKIRTEFFSDQRQAIRRMEELGQNAALRDTTLEDVFIWRMGRNLGDER